jgi:hypothetical protein
MNDCLPTSITTVIVGDVCSPDVWDRVLDPCAEVVVRKLMFLIVEPHVSVLRLRGEGGATALVEFCGCSFPAKTLWMLFGIRDCSRSTDIGLLSIHPTTPDTRIEDLHLQR